MQRLTSEELAVDAAKKEALERSTREFRVARDAEYRAAHRRLNRKERRKLAAEIAKVERGDYR